MITGSTHPDTHRTGWHVSEFNANKDLPTFGCCKRFLKIYMLTALDGLQEKNRYPDYFKYANRKCR